MNKYLWLQAIYHKEFFHRLQISVPITWELKLCSLVLCAVERSQLCQEPAPLLLIIIYRLHKPLIRLRESLNQFEQEIPVLLLNKPGLLILKLLYLSLSRDILNQMHAYKLLHVY